MNFLPSAKPVQQALRTYYPEVEIQIKFEIEKLLEAGIIKSIQHPLWLSSIVLVKKTKISAFGMRFKR